MEAKFHGPLDLRAYRSKRWKLLCPFKYTTLVFGQPVDIEVPKGFITDLASIPRAVRSLIPQVGRHRGPAVIHDFMYRSANKHDYSRSQCDRVFLEGMVVVGVPKWKRLLMWLAVRFGGHFFFNAERKK